MNEGYISALGQILLFIVGGALFVSISLLVSKIVRPSRPNQQKLATYESGESPIGPAWVQFNLRFYVIALIFILFEVEIIFLFPWATIFANEELINQTDGAWGWFALMEMIVFILILALGLAHAWVNGFLEWVKPDPKPADFKSPVPKHFYDKINEQYLRK
jgi:NADH-quinone oxidoreductase subunit A